MLKIILSLIVFAITLFIIADMQIDEPLLQGQALQNIDSTNVLTVTAQYNPYMDNISHYYNMTIKGALNTEEYLFIWNDFNLLYIYTSDDIINPIFTVNTLDAIKEVFYDNNILLIQTYSKTSFYILSDTVLSSVRFPYNCNIIDAAFSNNTVCAIIDHGRALAHFTIDTIAVTINDTLELNGINDIYFNNYRILCTVNDSLFRHYIVNDTTFILYNEDVDYRGIKGTIKSEGLFYSYSDNFIYIFANDFVFERQCLDSISISERVIDIDYYDNNLHILFACEEWISSSGNIFSITDTLHISDRISRIFPSNDGYFLWTDNGLKECRVADGSIIMIDSDLYPLNVIGDFIMGSDSIMYYSLNDTIASFNPSILPVYAQLHNNRVIYSDKDYNVYINDSLLFSFTYPVLGLCLRNNDFILANGYYGIHSSTFSGQVTNAFMTGVFATQADTFYNNIILCFESALILTDSNFNILSSYDISVKDYFPTDSMIYFMDDNRIVSVNDTIKLMLISNSYSQFKCMNMRNSDGAILCRDDALLTIHYNNTGEYIRNAPNIDKISTGEYILYDIMGRKLSANNKNLNGIYFLTDEIDYKKIIIIK